MFKFSIQNTICQVLISLGHFQLQHVNAIFEVFFSRSFYDFSSKYQQLFFINKKRRFLVQIYLNILSKFEFTKNAICFVSYPTYHFHPKYSIWSPPIFVILQNTRCVNFFTSIKESFSYQHFHCDHRGSKNYRIYITPQKQILWFAY